MYSSNEWYQISAIQRNITPQSLHRLATARAKSTTSAQSRSPTAQAGVSRLLHNRAASPRIPLCLTGNSEIYGFAFVNSLYVDLRHMIYTTSDRRNLDDNLLRSPAQLAADEAPSFFRLCQDSPGAFASSRKCCISQSLKRFNI